MDRTSPEYLERIGALELATVAHAESRRPHGRRWSWTALRWRCSCGAGRPCEVRAAGRVIPW